MVDLDAMRLIHCTQKLLKELDVKILEPNELPVAPEGLGNWYANLIRIDRKKCILFTNENTLYSFLIPNVLKKNIKNIAEEFLINLNLNLQAEGFNLEVINRVMQEYQEIGFATTVSRSVLGSMNDFAYQYDAHFEYEKEEGTGRIDILAINHQVNKSPMSMLKYESPLKALKSLLLRNFRDLTGI